MTDFPISGRVPPVALDPSGSPATAPDPGEDFQAWAAWREEQLWAELDARRPSPAEFASVVSALLERCYWEIDAVADELAIPVAPLDPTQEEIAEQMIAVKTAMATICLHPEMREQARRLLEAGHLDELVGVIAERADSIRSGAVADPTVRSLQAKARHELAAIYERHGRGEPSYRAFAKALRRRRFDPSPRHRAPTPRRPGAGQARARERRVRARARPSRGDPSGSDEDGDGDPDADEQGGGQPLRLRLPDGLLLEIPAAHVCVIESELRRWRRASRRSDDLADRIEAFLRVHPGETTSAIARGLKRRTADVRATLNGDGRFQRLPAGPERPANAKCWGLAEEPSPLVPQPGTRASAETARLAVRGGERR